MHKQKKMINVDTIACNRVNVSQDENHNSNFKRCTNERN